MPISRMRMNVASQLLLQELALKANCKYNPDKEEIKELSKVSMQCLSNSLTEKDNKTNQLITTKKIADEDKRQLNEFIFENSNPNNLDALPRIRTFIPYPDHNYGQQPPLTPPAEAVKFIGPSSITNFSVKSERTSTATEDEQGVTKCICGFTHDDGYMICCDDCSSWQHIDCMGIKSSKVPEKYSCHKCSPRELDIERARAIQAKKKENMAEGDDEEEEEETASEDESGLGGGQTMYTAISNTPTRITLLSSTNNITLQQQANGGKPKNKKGNRVQKKKLADQRNTRSRKTKRKEKLDDGTALTDDAVSFFDNESMNNFYSSFKLYEEIGVNKYDEEIQNLELNIPEASPAIDLNNIVKCHAVSEVTSERKGLLACCDIPLGTLVLEYKGCYMSLKKYEELNPVMRESCPYVASYNNLDTLHIVIDARTFGNDARFVRRSCRPNAELKHFMLNGLLHILIISSLNILKDSEITIPFDHPIASYKGYVECACGLEDCIIQQHNNEWMKLKSVQNYPSLYQNENSMSKLEIETQFESENESILGESKHEKLSREERKLQALMKQFEKLEKRQETTVKKVKEPKTPNSRSTSTDENTNPGNVPLLQKPLLTRKLSGIKRKSVTNARRRTRQSSCSSEPVSPSEQEVNSAVSTPTTPLSNSHPASLFEARNAKNGKKEPLTLTLPIQRKIKQEQSMASPTPPGTPLLLSPMQIYTENSTLALSLDTQSLLESTPMKVGLVNGLLQIAPTTPLSTSICSSFGYATAEEKMGDLTVRCGDVQPSPLKNTAVISTPDALPVRKYYGCMKKHWIRKYAQAKSTHLNGPKNGIDQVSLAALVASLSHQRHVQSSIVSAASCSPTPIFKRPKSCLPLKKRHLAAATRLSRDTQLDVKRPIHNISSSKIETSATSNHNTITQGSAITVPNEANVHSGLDVHVSNIPSKPESSLTIQTISSNYYSDNFKHERLDPNNSSSLRSHMLLQTSKSNPVSHLHTQIPETNLHSIRTTTANTESTYISIKRSHSSDASLEPQVKKRRNSTSVDSSTDSVLKIVISEPSPSKVQSNCTINSADKNLTEVPSTPSVSIEPKTELDHTTTLTPPRKSISSSPRSSVDSNPDSTEQGSMGKKKLSFKEYRSRQRNQKGSISSQNQSSSASSSNINSSDLKTQEDLSIDTTPHVQKKTLKLNEATDSLLTPRIVSLRETEPDKQGLILDSLQNDTNTNQELSSGANLDPSKRHSLEQNERLSIGSNNSVFEPVSPGNDFDSASPNPEETAVTFGQSIHSEITKNPFSIHSDITKNPFGKKQNLPAPGLLQFLSAQKYPHLANLGNNENTTASSTSSASNTLTQSQQQFSSSYRPTDYRVSEVENDDDASSTHSNISSTSYGSTSDVTHDRSGYSNHHRSFSRSGDYGSRETYYANQQHYSNHHQYYQNYNSHMQQQQQQQQHPNASRSSNLPRTTSFANYQQQSSHSSSRHRPSTNSRAYPPYQ